MGQLELLLQPPVDVSSAHVGWEEFVGMNQHDGMQVLATCNAMKMLVAVIH